jgi:hypothetical protein
MHGAPHRGLASDIRRMSARTSGCDGRAAGSVPAALPGPEQPKASPMPPDDGLGSDLGEGVSSAAPQPAQEDPEPPVGGVQAWTHGWSPPQTLHNPDWCGCTTEYLPVPVGEGLWHLVPIWKPDQTAKRLRRYEPVLPYWATDPWRLRPGRGRQLGDGGTATRPGCRRLGWRFSV